MENIQTTRIILASRPEGKPNSSNFQIETTQIAQPKDGELLLKILYLSLDPYMRGRMSDAPSYAPPVKLGDVMVGATVCEVVQSQHKDFQVGDHVLSYSGWQSYALANGAHVRKLDAKQAPISTALGVLGMPGFTAYAGLHNIGKPKAGETVAVAAATGPVGSMVGQIAKLAGAKTVGIAGGAEKCAFGRDVLQFDMMIDHKKPDFAENLAKACPEGIDVYFENVGGHVWDSVLPLLNSFARVPVCGLIAHYNNAESHHNFDRLPQMMSAILRKSLTIRGFIQNEFVAQEAEFLQQATQWVQDKKVHYKEDIVQGLENAPEAFFGLLEGKNFGKLVIQLN